MQATKKLKQKKCRNCKGEFTPWSSTQVICSPKCAYDHTKSNNEKELKRDIRRSKQLNRKELAKRKEKLKSRSDWLKLAQTPCNAYIRERDKHDGCISCDKPSTWGGQWHASHYRPSGNCSPLRFHPLNIHKSCSECNNFKSGNLSEFRIRLISKTGLDMVKYLESKNEPYQWEIDDIKEVNKHYREQLKILKEK